MGKCPACPTFVQTIKKDCTVLLCSYVHRHFKNIDTLMVGVCGILEYPEKEK